MRIGMLTTTSLYLKDREKTVIILRMKVYPNRQFKWLKRPIHYLIYLRKHRKLVHKIMDKLEERRLAKLKLNASLI
jgi:hypothetical protein